MNAPSLSPLLAVCRYFEPLLGTSACKRCPQELASRCSRAGLTQRKLYNECPWLNGPNEEDGYKMTCADGKVCSIVFDGDDCCDCHGGIVQCPRSNPNMCAGAADCPDGLQFCCLYEPCGVARTCSATFYAPPMDACARSPPSLPPTSVHPPPPYTRPSASGSRSVHVSDEVQLRAAVHDPSVGRVVLAFNGSSYMLQGELQLTHDIVLEGASELSAPVVLNASNNAEHPGRVLSVAQGVVVSLRYLQLTGGGCQRVATAAGQC